MCALVRLRNGRRGGVDIRLYPPLPLLPNAAAGPVSATAFAAGELSYRSVRLVLKGKRARVCDH